MQRIAHVSPSGDVTILTNDIPIVPKGIYPYHFITIGEIDIDLWKIMKKRYNRAIRIFRKRIDMKITEVYSRIPYYRDEDVSDLLLVMTKYNNNPFISEMLFDLIKKKQNARKQKQKYP